MCCYVFMRRASLFLGSASTFAVIEAWLQKVYADDLVPEYEINSRTLEVLSDLMKVYKRQELSSDLIVKDWQLKTEEYRLEADRLGKMLERFGLTPLCLSQSGTASLKTLIETSMILETRTASETELNIAMTRLACEKMDVSDARRSEKQLHEILLEKSKTRLQQCTDLKRALECIETQIAEQGPEMEKKAQQAEFLQIKAREYRQSAHHLKSELKAVGLTGAIKHGALTRKSESLKELKKKLQVIRVKLDSYHSLPPDLSLARVKIEETRQELGALEAELAKHIDLMHM